MTNLSCPRGFKTTCEICNHVADETKACDFCNNLVYDAGMLTCKILLEETEDATRKLTN